MKLENKIICLVIVLSSILVAQQSSRITVKGQVVDESTGAPLENALVFLSNTTIGTTTGKDGSFIISNVPYGSYDIIFRFIGYETVKKYLSSYEPRTFNFNVSLQQKEISLNAVSVTGSVPEDWKENLKIFTRLFIGESENAKETKIMNPEVINFKKDSKTNELIASSDSEIVIENYSLGYLVNIVLDNFVYTPEKDIRLSYYPRFKELYPTSSKQQETWEKNRKQTYLESKKHFFYALIHKELDKDLYTLHEGEINELLSGIGVKILPSDLNITCGSDSAIYSFNFTGGLEVEKILMPPSYLNFYFKSVTIDKFGNLLSSFYSVKTYGYWSNQRIADLLPEDYFYNAK